MKTLLVILDSETLLEKHLRDCMEDQLIRVNEYIEEVLKEWELDFQQVSNNEIILKTIKIKWYYEAECIQIDVVYNDATIKCKEFDFEITLVRVLRDNKLL